MTTTSLPRHTVLLVEDDSNDVLLFQRAFGRTNVNALLNVCQDGEEALHYLSGEGLWNDRERFPLPVLILLDLKLPRKSGLEVLAWIRAQKSLSRIPVVVFTSSRERKDVNEAYDLGANSYLVKPAGFEYLLDYVKTLWNYWLVLNEKPEIREPSGMAPILESRK